MPATYDADDPTDRNVVRLLITDVDTTAAIFQDGEIDAFLALEGDVRRAAAQALDTIASDQVLVLKVIKTLDLETDGAKVSAELRTRAKALRDRADQTDEFADTDGGFAIAELALPVFGYRDRMLNEIIRTEA